MSLYKPKGSGLWWVSLSHPDHPRVRRSTGTADRQEAQRLHDEWKAQLWSAAPIKGRTWGQAVILWASEEGRSASDIQSMAKFGRLYRDRPLSQVTLESLVAALDFCQSAATYMRYRGRLTAILNKAKAAGWLRDVPKLPTRRVQAEPRVWLTPKQWKALYALLPPHQQVLAEFSLETGLRQSNVLTLTWEQVDLKQRVVRIEAQDMKARKSVRVPLSNRAMELLRAQQDTHPEFVFTYQDRPITEVKTAFQRACVAAGLGSYVDGRYRGFKWHGLRHTWASWHLQRGTPIEVLKELGAWSDLRMVLNYGHHSPSHLARYAKDMQ